MRMFHAQAMQSGQCLMGNKAPCLGQDAKPAGDILQEIC